MKDPSLFANKGMRSGMISLYAVISLGKVGDADQPPCFVKVPMKSNGVAIAVVFTRLQFAIRPKDVSNAVPRKGRFRIVDYRSVSFARRDIF